MLLSEMLFGCICVILGQTSAFDSGLIQGCWPTSSSEEMHSLLFEHLSYEYQNYMFTKDKKMQLLEFIFYWQKIVQIQ